MPFVIEWAAFAIEPNLPVMSPKSSHGVKLQKLNLLRDAAQISVP
jgi:hypothetical protein